MGRTPGVIGSGLDLAGHNVLSFKSKQESLDAWALDELVGHYVTYRKLASIEATPANVDGPPVAAPGAGVRLLPATDFRLYAVATRRPARLLGRLHLGARRPGAGPGL